MSAAAFVLSLLSLIVACLALGWNIASWLLSKGRAKCILTGAHSVDEEGIERIIRIDPQGHTSFIGVEVQNVGRAPLVVRYYDVVPKLPRERGLLSLFKLFRFKVGWAGWHFGPDLPHTISPGDFATWWAPVSQVIGRTSGAPDVTTVRMRIITAHGRVVMTKNSYVLFDEFDSVPDAEAGNPQALPSQGSSSEAETTDPGPSAA